MPRKCCIEQCMNSQWKLSESNKEISFHSFPKNENKRLDWFHSIKVITGQTLTDEQRLRICSSHFLESDLVKVGQKFMLNKLAVPCIFPHLQHSNYDVLRLSLDLEPKPVSGVSVESIMSTNSEVANSEVSINNVDQASIVSIEEMDLSIVDQMELTIENNVKEFAVSNLPFNEGSAALIENMEIDNITIDEKPENVHTSNVHSTTKRTVRYPGDINEDEEMCPETTRRNIILCKKKVKAQAKEIYIIHFTHQ